MINGDFSQLLGSESVFQRSEDHPRILWTGLPFANNIIPQDRLSPNGVAHNESCTARRPTGYQTAPSTQLITSDNPQDQRKDNLRV